MNRSVFVGALALAIAAASGASALALEEAPVNEALPVGMVDEPCPPPLAMPPSVAAAREALVQPGQTDLSRLIELVRRPDFVAYDAENKARQARDWGGLCVYQASNAALAASGRRPQVILFGDSITENWVFGDPALFADGTVVGRGIGGQTSAQMLIRFRQDVVALHPRRVQIMAGTNDVAGNTGPTSARAWQDAIIAMVEIAGANHIEAVLASIPPADHFLWRPEVKPSARIVQLNGWLRDFARREGLAYIDYHAVLSDGHGGLRGDFALDGVHPNRLGYAAMRPLALSVSAGADRR